MNTISIHSNCGAKLNLPAFLQMTPLIALYFVATLITGFLAFRTWLLRPARGATYWAIAMISATIYVLGSGLEAMFTIPAWKLTMIPVIFGGLAGFSVGWMLFCLEYGQYSRWITRTTIAIVSVIPLCLVVVTLTSPLHTLFYRDYEFIEHNQLIVSQVVEYGVFFYVWAIYGYSTIVIGAFLVVRSALHSPNLFQGQAFAVIISVLIPIVFSLFYLFGYNPIAPFDPSPFSFTVSGMVMLYGMSRFEFLRINPIAYDVVFQNVSSAVIIVDVNNRILNMNPLAEALFQQSRDALIRQSVVTILPQLRLEEPQHNDATASQVEIDIADKYYDLKIAPIHNQVGVQVGRILMLHDISHRMEMQQQAIELAVKQGHVQFLKRFIDNVSHDFKTPLSSIMTTSYLMRKQFGDDAAKRLDTLDKQTDRLKQLVDNMLMVVRLDDSLDVTLHEIDLNELIATTIEVYPLPQNYDIQFVPDSNLPKLLINQAEFSLALTHLLENAITHSTPNDGITVSTEVVENAVQITVADRGTGIDEHQLPQIFDLFYRGDKARGTASGLSGLGLAIVKRVAERHGGTVSVESTVGEGSTFIIELPSITDKNALSLQTSYSD